MLNIVTFIGMGMVSQVRKMLDFVLKFTLYHHHYAIGMKYIATIFNVVIVCYSLFDI